MKKAVSILAILALTMGMFSCEPENTAQETDSLYGTLKNNTNTTMANDREVVRTDRR